MFSVWSFKLTSLGDTSHSSVWFLFIQLHEVRAVVILMFSMESVLFWRSLQLSVERASLYILGHLFGQYHYRPDANMLHLIVMDKCIALALLFCIICHAADTEILDIEMSHLLCLVVTSIVILAYLNGPYHIKGML